MGHTIFSAIASQEDATTVRPPTNQTAYAREARRVSLPLLQPLTLIGHCLGIVPRIFHHHAHAMNFHSFNFIGLKERKAER